MLAFTGHGMCYGRNWFYHSRQLYSAAASGFLTQDLPDSVCRNSSWLTATTQLMFSDDLAAAAISRAGPNKTIMLSSISRRIPNIAVARISIDISGRHRCRRSVGGLKSPLVEVSLVKKLNISIMARRRGILADE